MMTKVWSTDRVELNRSPQVQLGCQSVSLVSAKDESMLSQAVRDRYRCPEGFLDFRVAGQLSPDPGYFRFGPQAICYGRSANGVHQQQLNSVPSDTLASVATDEGHVSLPFDPNEVIDNLRLERYPSSQWSASESALKKIYYWLRPFTNRALRKRIQRFRSAQWQKEMFPQWPVDTTVENICETLLALSMQARNLDRVPFVWFWPQGARGCVAMTHDVETEAGRDSSSRLLDLDESFGMKASFQLVPEGRYTVTAEFRNAIRDRGFEIAVQDLNHDGRLFDDREEFRRRAAIINRYGREYGAGGFRAAILYRKPEWYRDLEFSYDMSIPNVARLDPQRGGCCTVMPYFIGDILELPLTTVQDYTLFHVLNERSISLWKEQVETIFSKHGLATFIVHPDYVTEPDTRAVYESLLRWLTELRQTQNLWFALPREINAWWRARHRMSVVADGDSWRITGEGADRAVLAFAKVVDGKLAYEVAGEEHNQSLRMKSKN